MSFFEGLGSAVEKSTVVLDIGAAYTKVGFASETGPRAIIQSSVKQPRTGQEVKVCDFSNSEELYDVLVDFLHVVYFRHLLVNPRDRRLVICESILCPSQFRETLAKVLFKHYEVPSVLFAPSHLLALFTLGIETALVLDAGYSETIVLPIYEGVPIIKGVQALPLGAKAIHSNLQSRLLEDGVVKGKGDGDRSLSSAMGSIPEETLEDIKVRTCFVTNMDRIKLIQQSILQADPSKRPAAPPAVEYPLDGGQILTLSGDIRETACEVLFNQDNEETSIATLILDSILKCPIDMRSVLASNLVTIGGTSILQGFNHRLLAEVHQLLKKPKYREDLAVTMFKIHEPPSQANYTAWLGGAIFGALEILSYRSLSKDAYLKYGRVPDWCSLDQSTMEIDPLSKDKTPRRLFRESFDMQASLEK
ncbi:actin-related protein 10-like [Asterias amurensis]|uniref:actin-related protein 10-like n=1 Tax=Asterias amurensis TaxID=7602 RepID=UPI003AB27E3A